MSKPCGFQLHSKNMWKMGVRGRGVSVKTDLGCSGCVPSLLGTFEPHPLLLFYHSSLQLLFILYYFSEEHSLCVSRVQNKQILGVLLSFVFMPLRIEQNNFNKRF